MEITSLKWANTAHSSMLVTTQGGETMAVPNPCRTYHRELIQAWLAAGNAPADPNQEPEQPSAAERAEDEIARSPALLAIIGWIAAEQGVTEEAVIQGMKTKLGSVGPAKT